MKKIFAVVIASLGLVAALSGCNKQVIDLTYAYDYAQISMPDGSIVEGKVQSWNDYEGEQIQITIDGVTYLVNSINCVLVRH